MHRANGHTKRITHTAFLGLISAYLLLTGCSGGGSSAIDLITPRAVSAVNVAGIKGPLAFADAKIFAFDPASPDFYHKNSPLSSAVTSQFATISGLSVPGDIAPPYILTIGGAGAIDIDTGMPPVISELVTVITQEMLNDGRPVYATPLTTLAFHMARLSTGTTTDANSFSQAFAAAADQVSQTFVMGQKVAIDILRSPLVMNDNTAAPGALKEAVYHRAAVETFAAQVYQLHLSHPDTTTDSFIESLALDLQADGIIDNSANGTMVGKIDPAVFRQPPMDLQIPNTSYQIRDVAALMQDERALLLADQGPEFLLSSIDFGNSPPSGTAGSFPLDLRGTTPEEATVTLTASKPADAATATLTLMTFDADIGNEGELVINGNGPVALFGASGLGGNDEKWTEITINTPTSYWKNGNNTLVFRHLSSQGYVIDQATVSFTSTGTGTPPPIVPKGNTLLSVDFQNIDRGGASAVRYTKEQLESDFQWDMLGYSHQEGGNNYYGPSQRTGIISADSVWIVPDPAGNTGQRAMC